MSEGRLLLVFPHPDDETFSSGGAIALHHKNGGGVTYMCGTLGQMGRNMGKPFFANRETLPKVRELELRDACSILGIDDLRLMGLRDKTVEFEDPIELAKRVRDVIEEVKPTVVQTFYPGLGVHPDHNALAYAAVRAVLMMDAEDRPQIRTVPVVKDALDRLGNPDIVVDVSSVASLKYAAIRAHKSQSEPMLRALESDLAGNAELKRAYEERQRTERFWLYDVMEHREELAIEGLFA